MDAIGTRGSLEVGLTRSDIGRLAQISRPGREALEDIPKFAFGPNWDKASTAWLHQVAGLFSR